MWAEWSWCFSSKQVSLSKVGTVFDVRKTFVFPRFAKDKQVFVHYQIKPLPDGLGAPASGGGTIMLELDDVFFQDEAGF